MTDTRPLFIGEALVTGVFPPSSPDVRKLITQGLTYPQSMSNAQAAIAQGTPAFVHILGWVIGSVYSQGLPSKIRELVDYAKGHGRTIIVGLNPPIYHGAPSEVAVKPLNDAIASAVAGSGARVVDYYSAMVNPDGTRNESLFVNTTQGTPNAAGVAVMQALLGT